MRRCTFTPIFYSAGKIPGTEAIAAQRYIPSLLRNNLNQEDSKMCSFVRARMSLVMVRSNTLLLRGTRYKGVYILQRPDMTDVVVMSLITLWKG